MTHADRDRSEIRDYMSREGTTTLGAPIKCTIDGQHVSFIVDGVIESFDRELGKYRIRGNSRGAQHIDWTIDAHWATQFYETPASDATCPPDAAETPADTRRAGVDPAEDRTEVQGRGLYPLATLTPEQAAGMAEDIGASEDSLFVDWINRGKEIEALRAERDAAQEHVAYHLRDYSLNGGLTGDLAVDMASYAGRMRVRAEAAEAKVARVELLIAHLTDFVYIDDLRAALDGA